MKPADRALVLALTAVLVLMLLIVAAPGPRTPVATGAGLVGEPREVDMDLLRRRILREELSDREALYYHRE